jgi:hypothetical protein
MRVLLLLSTAMLAASPVLLADIQQSQGMDIKMLSDRSYEISCYISWKGIDRSHDYTASLTIDGPGLVMVWGQGGTFVIGRTVRRATGGIPGLGEWVAQIRGDELLLQATGYYPTELPPSAGFTCAGSAGNLTTGQRVGRSVNTRQVFQN